MILVAVLDGLRPDMVTAEHMPFLYAMARAGTFCSASHAAFPTATRVNSASLSTGCYPNKHGLVGNELYSAAVDPYAAISCADWRGLQAIAQAEGGRLLTATTLAESLAQAGKRLVCLGSGSPGTTYLLNPTVSGPVLNWATAWPDSLAEEIERRFGPFLDERSDSLQRTDWVMRVLGEYLLPHYSPDVVLLWITEPDHSLHAHGLGSPEALAALREVDLRLERLVDALQRDADAEPDCLVTSDHGFSTVREHIHISQELATMRLLPGLEHLRPEDAVFAGGGLYLSDAALEHLPAIVRHIAARPWLGMLSVRDELQERCPRALPHSALFGQHPRSPHLMLAGSWDDALNSWGVKGSACSTSSKPATHGSASPHDVHNTLIAWGPRVRSAAISDVPCSIVDIAPTVQHLLGLEAPGDCAGRVLYEVLTGPTVEMEVTQSRRETVLPVEGRERGMCVHYSQVAGHRYLDYVSIEP